MNFPTFISKLEGTSSQDSETIAKSNSDLFQVFSSNGFLFLSLLVQTLKTSGLQPNIIVCGLSFIKRALAYYSDPNLNYIKNNWLTPEFEEITSQIKEILIHYLSYHNSTINYVDAAIIALVFRLEGPRWHKLFQWIISELTTLHLSTGDKCPPYANSLLHTIYEIFELNIFTDKNWKNFIKTFNDSFKQLVIILSWFMCDSSSDVRYTASKIVAIFQQQIPIHFSSEEVILNYLKIFPSILPFANIQLYSVLHEIMLNFLHKSIGYSIIYDNHKNQLSEDSPSRLTTLFSIIKTYVLNGLSTPDNFQIISIDFWSDFIQNESKCINTNSGIVCVNSSKGIYNNRSSTDMNFNHFIQYSSNSPFSNFEFKSTCPLVSSVSIEVSNILLLKIKSIITSGEASQIQNHVIESIINVLSDFCYYLPNFPYDFINAFRTIFGFPLIPHETFFPTDLSSRNQLLQLLKEKHDYLSILPQIPYSDLFLALTILFSIGSGHHSEKDPNSFENFLYNQQTFLKIISHSEIPIIACMGMKCYRIFITNLNIYTNFADEVTSDCFSLVQFWMGKSIFHPLLVKESIRLLQQSLKLASGPPTQNFPDLVLLFFQLIFKEGEIDQDVMESEREFIETLFESISNFHDSNFQFLWMCFLYFINMTLDPFLTPLSEFQVFFCENLPLNPYNEKFKDILLLIESIKSKEFIDLSEILRSILIGFSSMIKRGKGKSPNVIISIVMKRTIEDLFRCLKAYDGCLFEETLNVYTKICRVFGSSIASFSSFFQRAVEEGVQTNNASIIANSSNLWSTFFTKCISSDDVELNLNPMCNFLFSIMNEMPPNFLYPSIGSIMKTLAKVMIIHLSHISYDVHNQMLNYTLNLISNRNDILNNFDDDYDITISLYNGILYGLTSVYFYSTYELKVSGDNSLIDTIKTTTLNKIIPLIVEVSKFCIHQEVMDCNKSLIFALQNIANHPIAHQLNTKLSNNFIKKAINQAMKSSHTYKIASKLLYTLNSI